MLNEVSNFRYRVTFLLISSACVLLFLEALEQTVGGKGCDGCGAAVPRLEGVRWISRGSRGHLSNTVILHENNVLLIAHTFKSGSL